MPRWCGAASLVAALLLSACLGPTPERARILGVRVLRDAGGAQLELTQDLRFSRTTRDALSHGIPLRLVYDIQGCGVATWEVMELRYVPLTRHYELQRYGDAQPRSFARRSALLASLDRIRLPLRADPPADCSGRVTVALDLTSLPTPLRFPALLRRGEWRMVSPPVPWPSPSSPA